MSRSVVVQDLKQKLTGAYYTPPSVVSTLLAWAIRGERDRLLDPSCGDGRFIAGHQNSVGIEQDELAARQAMERAPWALVHEGDFFIWASETLERFDCVAGNPPFIRYQHFSGDTRRRALVFCEKLGAKFSGLSSSWAPFLVAAASRLNVGGRLAFVVPAEIGHAPYSAPLLEYLCRNFGVVHVVAVRKKLFPELSEDCWLLYAEGFGSRTSTIRFTPEDRFSQASRPPKHFVDVSLEEWRTTWNRRLRPFILPAHLRQAYTDACGAAGVKRLRDIACVGIGYVSGANGFFHLRPSEAKRLKISSEYLAPTVRNGRALRGSLTGADLAEWFAADDPVLLLKLPKEGRLPKAVVDYLNSEAGVDARRSFKCRTRAPWYSVPDVNVPDFFLSYMSGLTPRLVRNDAGCTGTNSVLIVRLHDGCSRDALSNWSSPLVQLSCELEGHPLGGGMLKLEPREASQVLLALDKTFSEAELKGFAEAVRLMQQWRHYASAE